MKLASLKGGRDGTLVVVSRDGTRLADASDIAPSLREALENWSEVEPALQARSEKLQSGEIAGSPVDVAALAAPLPRTFGWIDGSAYRSHIELMTKVMGVSSLEDTLTQPVIYQGAGDDMLGSTDDVILRDEEWGLDLEAELGAVLDDVPMGSSAADILGRIRLIVLLDDLSLRNLLRVELSRSFGPVRSKPATVFAPFAITPDELGAAWQDGKVDLEMRTFVNERQIGKLRTAVQLLYTFAEIAARVAETRNLIAGTIIGSGTVSNPQPLETAKFEQGGLGFGCIAEIRALEQITTGAVSTPFLTRGDTVRIEAVDASGAMPFGIIQHHITGEHACESGRRPAAH